MHIIFGKNNQRNLSQRQEHPNQQQSSIQKSNSSDTISNKNASASNDIVATTASSSITQPANKIIKRTTPILYSTNRGLYLRVTNHSAADTSNCNRLDADTTTDAAMSTTLCPPTAEQYTINFCDLERWSTNRANTVSLDDDIASVAATASRNYNYLSSPIPATLSRMQHSTCSSNLLDRTFNANRSCLSEKSFKSSIMMMKRSCN